MLKEHSFLLFSSNFIFDSGIALTCGILWVFFLFYQKTESALLIETIFYINNGQLKSFRMLNSPQLYSSAPLEQSTSLSHHQSDGKHSPLLQDVKLSAHAVSEIGKCILLDMHIHQWGTTIKKILSYKKSNTEGTDDRQISN